MGVYISSLSIILISSFLFLVQEIQSQENSNTCTCPMNYQPVCASNGQTYSTGCDLSCQQSTNPGVFQICEGECPCGLSGSASYEYEDYDYLNLNLNPSELLAIANGNALFDSPGPTPATVTAINGCSCTREINYICGSDGYTYANPCLFACSQQSEPGLTKLWNGPCS